MALNFNVQKYEAMEKLAVITVSSCWGTLLLTDIVVMDTLTHQYCRYRYLQVVDTVPVLNIDHQRYEDMELEKNRNRFPLAVLFKIDPGELDAAFSAASHARTEKQQPEAEKRLLNYV
ncbi:hypothetical protein Tco_0143024 [Tanacetum coccineum]